MKKLVLMFLMFLFLSTSTVFAYVNVKGYTRKDGTYVAPYVRSNPNGLKYDNYSWTPSQGLYNSTYGTRGSTWDTPTYITDPDYYLGKSLYESNTSSYSSSSSYYPTYTPTYSGLSSYSTYAPVTETKKEVKKKKREINSVSASYASKNDCSNNFMTKKDKKLCSAYLDRIDKYEWAIVDYNKNNYEQCGDYIYAKHLEKNKDLVCTNGVGTFVESK